MAISKTSLTPESNRTTIGIIANPFSSRDIRRLVSSATQLQTVERANILERIIVTLGTFGLTRVVMMPDKVGLAISLMRRLANLASSGNYEIPEVRLLDMPITSTAADTELASTIMRESQVDAVVVLEGDGTHRAVSKNIGETPFASISTGTNNAFPKFHEATLVGMALGLYAKNLVCRDQVLQRNKSLSIKVSGRTPDVALVDVAITQEKWIGARAIWRIQEIKELYLAFCEPGAIGLSAIGGLLRAVPRFSPTGLKLVLSTPEQCHLRVKAPILPGMFDEVGVVSSTILETGVPYRIETTQGVIALDGEREIEFSTNDEVIITLNQAGPVTIDVDIALELAMKNGAFLNTSTDWRENYCSDLPQAAVVGL